MKKYWIITFGCQMNISDSERIAWVLEKIGYTKTVDINQADLIVFNMCSVRQTAVDRVYGQANRLRRLKRRNKGLKTILTGCILGADKKKMEQIFDFVLDKKELSSWPEIINSKKIKKKFKNYLEINPIYTSKIQAFVPISNGCDNFCTYCAVPYTRGRLVSRNYKNILKEIKTLADSGYKEIWLLGENVNSYLSPGKEKKDFADLIQEIEKIKGDFWLRFTSPHPKDFSDKLINVLAKSKKFTPYLNLPLQSGDNIILRKMNRPYTAEIYEKLVQKIRKSFFQHRQDLDKIVGLSTDLIVGFPTETKAQFQNTAKMMKKIKFDLAFISQYSPRPSSFSYQNMKDDVLKKEKKQRDKILNQILKATALEKNKIFLNKIVSVLIFSCENGYYLGRTRQNKAIRIKAVLPDLVGQFIDVKITKVSAWSLEGEIIKPKIIVLAGPTASGKTELAIKLAKKFNGEIVSADSRLVYKKMDIGTAKPIKDKGQKDYRVRKIKHHLVDIVDLKQEFNVALFKEKAEQAINEIIEKGKTPFLVGGTGLYLKAIIQNLDFPKIQPDKKLRKELEKKDAEELFEIYKKLDSQGALKIDQHNKRRLVRAIEVCQITGQPFWQERKTKDLIYNVLELGLKPKSLDMAEQRIQERTKKMIKLGFEKEVRNLSKQYGFKIKPMQTIGYQEWSDFFKGKISKSEVEQNIVKNTIAFYKRQITWFKKEKTIKWIANLTEAEKEIRKFLK
ncbi:MAG: tRNA (N6-isopentenyl adenosine(37)-C2)-methylthiotransferase MiaB [Candidatus Paceibacterota bacterium]